MTLDRPSRTPWLEDLPKSWRSVRLKFVKRGALEYGANEAAELDDPDLPRFIRITDIREDGSLRDETFRSLPESVARPYLLQEGDILLARSGATVGKAFTYRRSWGRACFAGYLIRVRVDTRQASTEFLRYYTQSHCYQQEIQLSTIQATIQNVSAERYANFVVPLSSVEEQSAVVSLLDRKTAAIDALIAKKERLIELLQEKRQALITQAVTKGLDPNVPMKESGIPAIGHVPAHWEMKRLMHLTPPRRQIMYGIVLPGPNVAEGIPIVKSGDCVSEKLRLDRLHRTTPEIEAPFARARLQPGDIVYAIRGSIGMAAVVPPELLGANLTQDAARIAPSAGISSRWLLYVVQSSGVWSQLQAGVVGATVKGINIRDLKRPMVPVPPPDEHDAIARFLDGAIGMIDQTRASTEQSVHILREYRQALITAAVTGKIDVSKEAA